MNTAEQLAEWCYGWPGKVHDEIAAELRRQSAVIAALEAERDLMESYWNNALATHKNQAALEAENERLRGIESAAANLIKVKGRYHTEQAFTALVAAMKEQTP